MFSLAPAGTSNYATSQTLQRRRLCPLLCAFWQHPHCPCPNTPGHAVHACPVLPLLTHEMPRTPNTRLQQPVMPRVGGEQRLRSAVKSGDGALIQLVVIIDGKHTAGEGRVWGEVVCGCFVGVEEAGRAGGQE